MKVRTSRQASADLTEIFDYISRDSVRNAHAVLDRVIDAIDDLDRLERRGRRGGIDGTLELVVPRTGCVLIYRADETEVLILRVWRSARGTASLG